MNIEVFYEQELNCFCAITDFNYGGPTFSIKGRGETQKEARKELHGALLEFGKVNLAWLMRNITENTEAIAADN